MLVYLCESVTIGVFHVVNVIKKLSFSLEIYLYWLSVDLKIVKLNVKEAGFFAYFHDKPQKETCMQKKQQDHHHP